MRDRETDLSCLRIAKLVLTGLVICDVIDRSLSRIRPRSRTSFFGCTASAPMKKGLQYRCFNLREEEHQMNSDLNKLSCSRLHFIQSALPLMQLVETDRRCWTSVELYRTTEAITC